MKKVKIEQFDTKDENLLFWIKEYIGSKVYRLKPEKGFTSDIKKVDKDNNFFDREKNYNLIISSKDITELRNNSNKVARSMKGLRAYSSPLITFYEKTIADKKIMSIKDINTNYTSSYVRRNNIKSDYYVQIRSLFKFIDKNNLDDFAFNIGFLKDGMKAKAPVKMTKEKTYNYLEPDDFVAFIKSIKDYRSTHPNPYVLKLLVKFFCFGAFRADEVQHIKENDISFKNMENDKYMQIYILGKGDKERFVYIRYELIQDEYENYLRVKEEKKHKSEYLFYTRKLQMFSDKRIYDIVKDFHKQSKLEIKNFSCHTLRRTQATILHFLGVKLETISKILGHSNEETTEFYVFATNTKNKNVSNLFKFY